MKSRLFHYIDCALNCQIFLLKKLFLTSVYKILSSVDKFLRNTFPLWISLKRDKTHNKGFKSHKNIKKKMWKVCGKLKLSTIYVVKFSAKKLAFMIRYL